VRAGSAADALRIDTAEQYRDAVSEVQRLEGTGEGSAEFDRLQALRAALYDYEQRHLRPAYRPGRPRRSTGR
jgi:hypothetical protein